MKSGEGCSEGGSGVEGGPENCSSTRRAMGAPSSASPRATDRMVRRSSPRSASLSMYPRARLERREYQLVVLEHRDHDDAHVRAASHDGPRGLYAAHAGHLEVHEHDIGEQLFGQAHGLFSRGGFPDKPDVIGPLQQTRHTLAEERVIVGQKYPRGLARSCLRFAHRVSLSTGMRAATRVPASGWLSTCSVPPSSSDRSRMLPMPVPSGR